MAQFQLQELSNSAWAFAKLQLVDDPFMEAISAQARAKMSLWPAQELANTAWAFARLAVTD